MTACLRPAWPAPPNVRTLVTLRDGGTSVGPYASFNLATHVGDEPGVVAGNRAHLVNAFELPSEPCWLEQTHGATCVAAHDRLPTLPQADAAWTNRRGVVCAVLTADCLPILLCDAKGTTVAAVHAGWRGLAGGVLASAVANLPQSQALMAWIGPGIGPAAYRVDETFRARFIALDRLHAEAFSIREDGWHCDLAEIAIRQLSALGVQAITRYPGCSHAEADRFFSHRRDGVSGRFASLIWLH